MLVFLVINQSWRFFFPLFFFKRKDARKKNIIDSVLLTWDINISRAYLQNCVHDLCVSLFFISGHS